MKIKLTENGKDEIIKIHNFDTWSVDLTLARIIVPLLEQLRDTTHGSPIVDNEDVHKELRFVGERNWLTEDDEHYHKRWTWVLNEMIWTFKTISGHEWEDALSKENEKRIDNGTRLFGKYYRALWD